MGQYNGALTREQFLFREMRIVARLYREGLSPEEITERIYQENLFQYPTEREIKSKCRTALKRLNCIAHSPALVEMLAEGDLREAKWAALTAMMAQNALVAEFMTDVVGEKFRGLDRSLTSKDFYLFYETLCQKDPKAALWSPSTVKKNKAVLWNLLRENGYLERPGSETLCPALISEEFELALRQAGFQRFLPAFQAAEWR